MLSGDSTVKSFTFDGQELRFLYEDEESMETYKVVVETPIIYSEEPGGEACVHMRIEASEDKLDIDERSGRFVLPAVFQKQMAAINKGYHVLAGLKSTDYPHIFILTGNARIVLCPIKGKDRVDISPHPATTTI